MSHVELSEKNPCPVCGCRGREAALLAQLDGLSARFDQLLHTARELGLEVTERPGGGWGARNARADRQRETYREALGLLEALGRVGLLERAYDPGNHSVHDHDSVAAFEVAKREEDAKAAARAFLDAHPLPQVLEVERRQEAEAQAQAARLEATLREARDAMRGAALVLSVLRRGGMTLKSIEDWEAMELMHNELAVKGEAARAALEEGR